MTAPGKPRAGGEKRGNSTDRRRRREWMVSAAAGFGGDGVKVPCVWCGCYLTVDSVEADRIKPGGSYRRDNVQPSCRADNLARSNNVDWSPPTV